MRSANHYENLKASSRHALCRSALHATAPVNQSSQDQSQPASPPIAPLRNFRSSPHHALFDSMSSGVSRRSLSVPLIHSGGSGGRGSRRKDSRIPSLRDLRRHRQFQHATDHARRTLRSSTVQPQPRPAARLPVHRFAPSIHLPQPKRRCSSHALPLRASESTSPLCYRVVCIPRPLPGSPSCASAYLRAHGPVFFVCGSLMQAQSVLAFSAC